MELSGLTSDAKFLLAKELPTKDLLALCSTDSNMKRICISERFNPIWSQRLKNDYNIDYKGSNGYIEYMLATYVLKQKYYAAIFYNTNDMEMEDVILCRKKSEGYAKVTQKLNKIMTERKARNPDDDIIFEDWPYTNVSYFQVKILLSFGSREIEIGPYKVSLERAHFDSEPVENYKEIYGNKLKAVAERLFPNDPDKREKFIENFENNLSDDVLDKVPIGADRVIGYLSDNDMIPKIDEDLSQEEYDERFPQDLIEMIDDLLSFN